MNYQPYLTPNSSKEKSTLKHHHHTVDSTTHDGVGGVQGDVEEDIMDLVIFCPVVRGQGVLDLRLKQLQVFLKHESFKLNPGQDTGEGNKEQGGRDHPDKTDQEGGDRQATAAQTVAHGGDGGDDGDGEDDGDDGEGVDYIQPVLCTTAQYQCYCTEYE